MKIIDIKPFQLKKRIHDFYYLRLLVSLIVLVMLGACDKDKDKAVPLTSLEFYSAMSSTFFKGEVIELKIQYLPHSGTYPNLSWESSDTSIVKITGNGTALAVKMGASVITVKVNDGTGLKSSKIIYIQDLPKISITSISDITYYSATFLVNYNSGGDSTFRYGFCFDTIPQFDTTNCIAVFHSRISETSSTVDYFEANRLYYVKAFIANTHGISYSDSVIVNTKTSPLDLNENYMLNIALTDGCVAKLDDWVYFVSNKYSYLYRIRTNLTEKQEFKDEFGVKNINICRPYIYFNQNGPFKNAYHDITNINKFYIPGFNRETNAGKILLYNNYIYNYKSGNNCTIRMKVNSAVSEDIGLGKNENINIYNDKIYSVAYPESSYVANLYYIIYVCNLDGSDKKELYKIKTEKEATIDLFLGIYGGFAFFRERGMFRKMNLEFPDLIETLPITPMYGRYNIANDAIFYSNEADNGKLYKTDLLGLTNQKLSDDIVKYIYIIDDWLYYYNWDGKNDCYRIKQDGTARQLVY